VGLMARTPRKKQASQPTGRLETPAFEVKFISPDKPQSYRPLPIVDGETARYYANYLEVTSTPFDFVLTMATITNKLTAEQNEEIKRDGTLTIRSHLQVIIPIGFLQILAQMLSLTAQNSLTPQPQGEEK